MNVKDSCQARLSVSVGILQQASFIIITVTQRFKTHPFWTLQVEKHILEDGPTDCEELVYKIAACVCKGVAQLSAMRISGGANWALIESLKISKMDEKQFRIPMFSNIQRIHQNNLREIQWLKCWVASSGESCVLMMYHCNKVSKGSKLVGSVDPVFQRNLIASKTISQYET